MHALRLTAQLLLGAALLAGCSSADDSTGSTAAPATSSSAAPTDAPHSGAEGGCPAAGHGVPAGAHTRPTLDVDGDGAPDTLWIDQTGDGDVTFGITTASGATFTSDFRSASPVSRSVLVADVTGNGELIALADDGRQVLLYAVSRCSFVAEQNIQGEQYAFDLGFTGFGTGVGCTDVDGDGVRDLAGLRASDDGTGVDSTVVTLDGPRATNSDTTSSISDAGPAAVDRARHVTCGDLTLAEDGVSIEG